MNTMTKALVDALAVVGHGMRLIAAYLPVLLTIYFLGSAARGAFLWAAVVVSDYNGFLGALLVPLAPLSTLTALILMLRVVSPGLRFTSFDPGATKAGEQGEASEQGEAGTNGDTDRARAGTLVHERLALLASTLVPFLAVYAAQGYLKEDAQRFLNEASADEFYQSLGGIFTGAQFDQSRTLIAEGAWLWLSVAVALALRWLVNKLDLPAKATAWGLFAAWLEVTWVTLFANQVPRAFGYVTAWASERSAAVWAEGVWSQLVDVLGPAGAALDAVRAWFWGALGQFDALVIIPIAWLTVGAVVYGKKINQSAARIKTRERIDARMKRLPRPVARWSGDFLDDLSGRFAGLAKGLKLLAVAGLIPMLLFCLVFLLATQAKYATREVIRVITGPMAVGDSAVVEPWMDSIAQGVYTVLVVGLLAAAVDRVLGRQAELSAAADAAVDGVDGPPSLASIDATQDEPGDEPSEAVSPAAKSAKRAPGRHRRRGR